MRYRIHAATPPAVNKRAEATCQREKNGSISEEIAKLKPRQPKRDMIFTAASRVFIEHGFEGASMDHVAQAAGAARRTLYNQFPGGKQELSKQWPNACGAPSRQWILQQMLQLLLTPKLVYVASERQSQRSGPHRLQWPFFVWLLPTADDFRICSKASSRSGKRLPLLQ